MIKHNAIIQKLVFKRFFLHSCQLTSGRLPTPLLTLLDSTLASTLRHMIARALMISSFQAATLIHTYAHIHVSCS